MSGGAKKQKHAPGILIRDIQQGDLEFIADNLRNADREELAAASGHTNFLSRLEHSVDLSETMKVVEAGGLPVLVFGNAAFGPDTKAVWCVGAKQVEKYRRPLVEQSRRVIRDWFRVNPEVQQMVNFSYAKNKLYHRWLEGIGAEIFPAQPLGPSGAMFLPFIIRRDSHV